MVVRLLLGIVVDFIILNMDFVYVEIIGDLFENENVKIGNFVVFRVWLLYLSCSFIFSFL